MEDVVCSGCGATPADTLEGWKLDGEFGESCPECRLSDPETATIAGIEGIAAAVGATKEES